MKRFLLILLPVMLLGGVGAGLYSFGILPPRKPGKAAHKKAATDSRATDAKSPSSETAPPSASSPAMPSTAGARGGLSNAKPAQTEDDEKSLTRLTSVYEQMPVEEASRIMLKLPDALVEKMLRRMDERQVGKLLPTFGPERAAKLTLALARAKNESPRKNP